LTFLQVARGSEKLALLPKPAEPNGALAIDHIVFPSDGIDAQMKESLTAVPQDFCLRRIK